MEKTGITLENSDKEVKIGKLALLKSMFNIIRNTTSQKYTYLPAEFISAIQAFSLGESKGKIVWKLISIALADSLIRLVIQNGISCEKEDIVTEDLDKQLDKLLFRDDYIITNDFFKNPYKLKFLDDADNIIRGFLELFEFEKYEIDNMMNRLESYFNLAIIKEYKNNIEHYKIIYDTLNTPFDEVEENIFEWYKYRQWLLKQIEEPIFNESFGLNQIYIQLNAYYKIKDNEKEKNIIVDIEKELMCWIGEDNKDDAIKIIRGGPGYGKSSFFKMFASKLAKDNHNIIFIPLHNINMDSDMCESIKKFLKNSELLKIDPFESDKLIIIFDGLDELTMQGKTISESANSFVREIHRQVTSFNTTRAKLKVLISGRDIVIQNNENEFRKEKQIYRLLPYFLDKKEKDKLKEIVDKDKLLETDKRDIWWTKYGQLKNTGYSKLPNDLKKKELDDITSQPLLNYLIALSYGRGEVDFENETNLNTIYDDLLIGVYDRAYDGNTHKSLHDIEKDDFKRVLEEIGVSTWHGDGRTTTVKEIGKHFETAGLKMLLNNFIKDAEKGVVSLLASFYFKKSGQTSNGDETFEFTHKSFGEYLTAKRIVSSISQIHKKYSENTQSKYGEDGWNITQSLEKWLDTFAKKEIDIDLHKFIDNEIRIIYQKDPKLIEELQKIVIMFINYTLENGLPLEKLSPRVNFYHENRLSINAEKALLLLHGTIAKYTNNISKIDINGNTLFGEWISRLNGQRSGKYVFILRFLNHLDLSYFRLDMKDFYGANLSHSIFYDSKLIGANLIGANLTNTDFKRANLVGANLTNANLTDADLRNANLTDADFTNADLRGVDLTNTDLRGVNLLNAKRKL